MVTEYGVAVVRNIFIAVIVLMICTLLLLDPGMVQYSIIGVLVVFSMLVLFFFRDPNRITPVIDNCVIAPADGKVIQISDAVENDFLKEQCVQISIFMSPLNVHVNRFPIT
ncbi:MAG TPA: phosphatidylserine decarboxylase, partial [Bacteroidota bacterium]|nr:phosphatidylserine decarboxylase [Bacteroidota bacterium]